MRRPRLAALVFVAVLAVPCGLLMMQLPTLTAAYQADLVQSARALRSVIDRDVAAVRTQYSIDVQDDGGVVEALRQFDPAHSVSLGADVAEWRGLEAAAERIDSVPAIAQPFAALLDLADDQKGERRNVWQHARDASSLHLALDPAALAYAGCGLMLGVLAAEIVLGAIATVRRTARRIRRRRLRHRNA